VPALLPNLTDTLAKGSFLSFTTLPLSLVFCAKAEVSIISVSKQVAIILESINRV
jgi:hypothetical protein